MKFLPFLLSMVALFGSAEAQQNQRKIGGKTLPQFLQQFDTNEDGRIDEEERQAIRDYRRKLREERRNTIDTNDDGHVSHEEIQAAREAIRHAIKQRRQKRFLEIAGEDGLLTREEFSTIPGISRLPEELADGLFARLDTDESGDVTADEFHQRLRTHTPRRKHPSTDKPDSAAGTSPENDSTRG